MTVEFEGNGLPLDQALKNHSLGNDGFESVMFYLDGDSEAGELDLPALVSVRERLKLLPDFDIVVAQINSTMDLNGREGIALHLPSEARVVLELGSPDVSPQVGSQSMDAAVDKPEIQGPGKALHVTARRKGFVGKPVDFTIVVYEGEDEVAEARDRIAYKMHTDPNYVDITIKPADDDFVIKKARQDIINQRMVDKRIIEKYPEVAAFLKKRQNSDKSKGFRR